MLNSEEVLTEDFAGIISILRTGGLILPHLGFCQSESCTKPSRIRSCSVQSLYVWQLILITRSFSKKADIVVPNLWFIHPVCNTPLYTQSRGILLRICADNGCLSQDSTPQASRSSYLYKKHQYIQYALLFC